MLNRIKSFRFPASEYLLKNSDVGTLGVLGICFASATASGLLGLSPALGAFLGGLAVGHSTLRRGALAMAQPVQSILLFVFFLSVGLLIDLNYLIQQAWIIGAALVVVTGGKTVLNFILLTLGGKNFDTAFAASLFLSPVGEFSFVIAGAGLAAGHPVAGRPQARHRGDRHVAAGQPDLLPAGAPGAPAGGQASGTGGAAACAVPIRRRGYLGLGSFAISMRCTTRSRLMK